MLGVVGGVRSNAAPIPIRIVRRDLSREATRWKAQYFSTGKVLTLASLCGDTRDIISELGRKPSFDFKYFVIWVRDHFLSPSIAQKYKSQGD